MVPLLGGSQIGQLTALLPLCSGMFRLSPSLSSALCSGTTLLQAPWGPLGTDPEPH